MKKIISLFQRNYDTDHLVRDEIVPGAEWVVNGEGVATRKYDGTCCMIRNGVLYRRYDAKHGKTPPEGFEPAQEPDIVTGHWPGWIPVGDSKNDQYHREAFAAMGDKPLDGTYELCGEKIQGNPENFNGHVLVKHGVIVQGVPRNFYPLKEWMKDINYEGIVWHHPDGRMVKIKRSDFYGKKS